MIQVLPSGAFKRSGAAEYWAIIRPDQDGAVVDAGYSGKTMVAPPGYQIWTTDFIQAVSGGALAWLDQADAEGNQLRTDLEKFMLALYLSGANMTQEEAGEWERFSLFHLTDTATLHADIIAAGLKAEYGSVRMDQLLAMTGAISRYATNPDSSRVDIIRLGPNDATPLLPDLQQVDSSKVFQVLRRIRLWGLVPILYAQEYISWGEFMAEFRHYFPDPAVRLPMVPSLVTDLRMYGAPLLFPDQIADLKTP